MTTSMLFPKIGIYIPFDWMKTVGTVHRVTKLIMPENVNQHFQLRTSHYMKVRALVGTGDFDVEKIEGIQVDSTRFDIDEDRIINLEDTAEFKGLDRKERSSTIKRFNRYVTALSSASISHNATTGGMLGASVPTASTSLTDIAKDKHKIERLVRKTFDKRKRMGDEASVDFILSQVAKNFPNYEQITNNISNAVTEFIISVWSAQDQAYASVQVAGTRPSNDEED